MENFPLSDIRQVSWKTASVDRFQASMRFETDFQAKELKLVAAIFKSLNVGWNSNVESRIPNFPGKFFDNDKNAFRNRLVSKYRSSNATPQCLVHDAAFKASCMLANPSIWVRILCIHLSRHQEFQHKIHISKCRLSSNLLTQIRVYHHHTFIFKLASKPSQLLVYLALKSPWKFLSLFP